MSTRRKKNESTTHQASSEEAKKDDIEEETDNRTDEQKILEELTAYEVPEALAQQAAQMFAAEGYDSVIQRLEKDSLDELISPTIKRGVLVRLLDALHMTAVQRPGRSSTQFNWRSSLKVAPFVDGSAPEPYWSSFIEVATAQGVPEGELTQALLFANADNVVEHPQTPSFAQCASCILYIFYYCILIKG